MQKWFLKFANLLQFCPRAPKVHAAFLWHFFRKADSGLFLFSAVNLYMLSQVNKYIICILESWSQIFQSHSDANHAVQAHSCSTGLEWFTAGIKIWLFTNHTQNGCGWAHVTYICGLRKGWNSIGSICCGFVANY